MPSLQIRPQEMIRMVSEVCFRFRGKYDSKPQKQKTSRIRERVKCRSYLLPIDAQYFLVLI